MSKNEVVDLSYKQIEQPLYMIPIITNNTVDWICKDKFLKTAEKPINKALQDEFDNIFTWLKMHVDEFNLTYLCYSDNCYLINDSKTWYDEALGLNSELKIKCTNWKKDLDRLLSKIHDLYNKMHVLMDTEIIY